MAQARVFVLNEVKTIKPSGWNLCFQYCRYEYGDAIKENAYRFIWRRPNGNLQGATVQAHIPSTADILLLTSSAISQGWGHHICPESSHESSEE